MRKERGEKEPSTRTKHTATICTQRGATRFMNQHQQEHNELNSFLAFCILYFFLNFRG